MILADREELLELKQIPTPEQPQAIVMVTVKDGQGRRQGIGVADGYGTKGKYQPGELLDAAAQNALEKAKNGYGQTDSPQKTPQPTPRNTRKEQIQQNKKAWTHNQEAGSISEGQLSTLRQMATERNQSLENLSQDIYGVVPEQLSSEQAQTFFQQWGKRRSKSR